MEDRIMHSLVGALRAVPSLGTLDDRTLLTIVGDSANLFWGAGSKVFAKGSPGDGGKELGVLREGDFFGEMSLLHGAPHQKDVEAVEDTELLVVAKECFDDLVAASSEVARSILQTAEDRGASDAAA